MGKFVISTERGKFRFDLLAANHEPIAYSNYFQNEVACLKMIQATVRAAAIAKVEDQTKKDYLSQRYPKFEVYVDRSGKFRFCLREKNGAVLLASQAYKAKASCLNGIRSVVRNTADELSVSRKSEYQE